MSDQPQQKPDGQISEVNGLDRADADTPISDGDNIAASPSQESGDVDEGDEVGPAARTGREDRPSTPERTSHVNSKKDIRN